MSKELETAAAQSAEKEPDSVYSVDELAGASGALFGVGPDLVRAAFRMEGMTEATRKKARQVVDKFRKREVQ